MEKLLNLFAFHEYIFYIQTTYIEYQKIELFFLLMSL